MSTLEGKFAISPLCNRCRRTIKENKTTPVLVVQIYALEKSLLRAIYEI